MSDYYVRNTGSNGKSFVASNGKRIHFEPGEEKKISSLPPEFESARDSAAGWEVGAKENSKAQEDNEEEEGGEQ